MSVATSTAIAIGLGVSGAAALGGAALSAGAAGNAASKQANAADQAAELQYQESQQALQFQEQQYANSLGLMEPYYQTGTNSLSTLAQLMGMPGVQGNTSVFNSPFGGNAPQSINPFGAPTGNPGTDLSTIGNGAPQPGLEQFRGGPSTSNLERGGVLNFGPGGTAPGNVLPNGQGSTNTLAPGGTIGNMGFGGGRDPNAIQPGGTVQMGPPATSGNGIQDVGGAGGPQRGGTIGPNGQFIPPAGNGSAAPGTVSGTGLPAGFLTQTFDQPFVPPDAITEQNDPGFKARLAVSQQALENSAAAKGNLLSGNQAEALDQFAQTDASQEYGNVYNRALQNYNTAYNVFNQNQSNIFNRYADLAGLGQTAAGQLTGAGLTTGANVGNTLLTSGAQIGNDLTNAGAARASGIVGSANALSGGLSGIGNLATLYSILNQGGGGVPSVPSLFGG